MIGTNYKVRMKTLANQTQMILTLDVLQLMAVSRRVKRLIRSFSGIAHLVLFSLFLSNAYYGFNISFFIYNREIPIYISHRIFFFTWFIFYLSVLVLKEFFILFLKVRFLSINTSFYLEKLMGHKFSRNTDTPDTSRELLSGRRRYEKLIKDCFIIYYCY